MDKTDSHGSRPVKLTMTCEGITKAGRRCKNKAVNNGFCRYHQIPTEDTKKIKQLSQKYHLGTYGKTVESMQAKIKLIEEALTAPPPSKHKTYKINDGFNGALMGRIISNSTPTQVLESLLFRALRDGDTEIPKYLLETGRVSFDLKDNPPVSILQVAVEHCDDPEFIKFLLNNGDYDPSYVGWGNNIMSTGVATPHLSLLIERFGLDPKRDYRMLNKAVVYQESELVAKLLDWKFDPNLNPQIYDICERPFERASSDGNIEIMRLLLNANCTVTLRSLDYAMYRHQYPAIDLIIEKLSNPSESIKQLLNQTPYRYDKEVLDYLEKYL